MALIFSALRSVGCLSPQSIPTLPSNPFHGTNHSATSERASRHRIHCAVIIGILAAIAIPKFANTKSKAYITAMKSDLRNLVTAEEAFFSDSSKYTSAITLLKYQNSTGTIAPTITTGAGFWTATNAHTQLTGMTCAIGINTTNPLAASGVTAAEGEPACK